MEIKTLEDWIEDRERRFRNWGKYTYMGVEAKLNLARAKKNYEEELAYHNLNPSNPSSALAVKRAKKTLDYWQDQYDTWD